MCIRDRYLCFHFCVRYIRGTHAYSKGITIFMFLFERSEFLIDTSQKKSLRVCTCARVHACSTNLGFSVWYYVPHTYVSHISSAPKIRMCRYVCTRATSLPPKKSRRPSTGSGSDTRTARQSLHSNVRVTTTASVTEGVPAVSWIQSSS